MIVIQRRAIDHWAPLKLRARFLKIDNFLFNPQGFITKPHFAHLHRSLGKTRRKRKNYPVCKCQHCWPVIGQKCRRGDRWAADAIAKLHRWLKERQASEYVGW